MQNGQTEPAGVCPEVVHRYDEWFGLFVVKNIKTKGTTYKSFPTLLNKIFNFLFLTICAKCNSTLLVLFFIERNA